jgi:hypothetical protein
VIGFNAEIRNVTLGDAPVFEVDLAGQEAGVKERVGGVAKETFKRLGAQEGLAGPPQWNAAKVGQAREEMQQALSSDVKTQAMQGGVFEPTLQGVSISPPLPQRIQSKQQVMEAQLASDQMGMRKYTKEMPDRLKEEMEKRGYQVTVTEKTSTLKLQDRRTMTFTKNQKSFSTTCETHCSCTAKLASTEGGVTVSDMKLQHKPPVIHLNPLGTTVTQEKKVFRRLCGCSQSGYNR